MDEMIFVALGDSLTYGYGVLEHIAYPARLKKEFPHWKVVNRGVNGDTTREALARLNAHVLTLRPQIVAIWLGSNDSAMTEGQYRPLIEFEKNLRKITEALLACEHGTAFNGGKTLPLFITPPPVVDTNFFPFTTTDRVALYSDSVKKIAEEYQCPVIDFFSVLWAKKEEAYEDFFQADGDHLSNLGYDLFYSVFQQKIKELLKNS